VVPRQYYAIESKCSYVMPIIFAQAIMFIPLLVAPMLFKGGEAEGMLGKFTSPDGFWYNLIFALLIILFTYFYTAITINPTQMAEDMKRNGGFVPGVKAGSATQSISTDYVKITLLVLFS
jgi:preprotein translocase subunit SecY